MKKLERLLKALANRRRIEILRYLSKHERATVGVVSEYIKLSFKSTSKHLNLLKSVEAIESEQVGLSVHYSLLRPPQEIVKVIIESNLIK